MSERPWYTCLCGQRYGAYSKHPWECPEIAEAVRAYEESESNTNKPPKVLHITLA